MFVFVVYDLFVGWGMFKLVSNFKSTLMHEEFDIGCYEVCLETNKENIFQGFVLEILTLK